MRLAQHLKAVADPQHQPAVAARRRSPTPSPARSARSPRRAGSRRRRSRRARRSRRRPSGRARRATAARRRPPAGRRPARRPRRSEPGNWRTPNFICASAARRRGADLVVLDERVGEQLLAHRLELGRVLDVELDQPPDVHVRHAREAERRQRALDGLPWGSRMPAFGRISTRAPLHRSRRRPCGPASLEGLAGDQLVRLDVARAGARDDVLGDRRRRRPLVPAAVPRPSRARTACRSSAAPARPRSRPRASSARSRASAPRRPGPPARPIVLVQAQLELRVGQDHAALARVLGGERVQLDRHVAHALHQRPVADQLGRALEVDRLVVARPRPSCSA